MNYISFSCFNVKKLTFYSFVCFENEYKLYIIIIIIKHSFDMPCY